MLYEIIPKIYMGSISIVIPYINNHLVIHPLPTVYDWTSSSSTLEGDDDELARLRCSLRHKPKELPPPQVENQGGLEVERYLGVKGYPGKGDDSIRDRCGVGKIRDAWK